MGENRVIGKDNSLIWKLSDDLKRFKKITMNSTVVMGRKTYESIGCPLPKRKNIIITRDPNYKAKGCIVVNSLEDAIYESNNDCFIIGGGEIYKQAMSLADKMYVTIVHENFDGDAFFPMIDENWSEILVENNEKDINNEYNYTFVNYERYKF